MRVTTLALRDLLASRQFGTAALLTFLLSNGATLRYCTGDTDLTWSGNTFLCGGQSGPFFFSNGKFPTVNDKIGTDVSSLTFTALPGSSLVNGVPFRVAMRMGFFSGADFTYERAYMATADLTTIVGTVIRFAGRVGTADTGRSGVYFTINSHTELLAQNWPHDLYQPGCRNTLYDASCTLSRAAHGVSDAVAAATTRTVVPVGGIGGAGIYDLGSIVFTSGAASTMTRMVRKWDGVTLTLASALPVLPVPGDTFTVYQGCNKSVARCVSFANLANYRGFPDVPAAETAI